DSSMNVEEVSSIVVDTAFHPHRERRSSLRHYLDDRTLVYMGSDFINILPCNVSGPTNMLI
ncbi:MAG: hypothetical protein ACXQT2_06010, partial [Methanotrichaceae archaeon]